MDWFHSLDLLSVLKATGTGAVLVAWWRGLLEEYLPGPKRVVLALKNVLRSKAQASEDRFRIVLCWLANDPHGDNTRHVEEAFTHAILRLVLRIDL